MPESQFDYDPENYDRARPSYPPALFDDLWAYLDPGARAQPATVEVGPATGQATHSLLARGARVTAVELGPRLAAFLAAKYVDQPALRVVNAAFEDALLPEASADLLFSATAYHWVDAAVRMSRPHALLRPGGIISGPTLMTLADSAAYALVLAHIGDQKMAVTSALVMNFLRGAAVGDIWAEARLLRLGRRNAVCDVHLWTESPDRIAAQATVTYSLP